MNKKLVIQAMLVLITVVILSLSFISCIKIYSDYIQWLFDITSDEGKGGTSIAGIMLSIITFGTPVFFVIEKKFIEE